MFQMSTYGTWGGVCVAMAMAAFLFGGGKKPPHSNSYILQPQSSHPQQL